MKKVIKNALPNLRIRLDLILQELSQLAYSRVNRLVLFAQEIFYFISMIIVHKLRTNTLGRSIPCDYTNSMENTATTD